MKFDITTLKALAKSLNENDIAEFTYEEEGTKISLKRGQEPVTQVVTQQVVAAQAPVQQQAAVAQAPVAAAVASASEDSNLPSINSPMVGTFYGASSPGAAPFVKEGDSIVEGQVLCIVEAMKLMNEVKADKAGVIAKVLAQNGQAVKKGDKLFLIK